MKTACLLAAGQNQAVMLGGLRISVLCNVSCVKVKISKFFNHKDLIMTSLFGQLNLEILKKTMFILLFVSLEKERNISFNSLTLFSIFLTLSSNSLILSSHESSEESLSDDDSTSSQPFNSIRFNQCGAVQLTFGMSVIKIWDED